MAIIGSIGSGKSTLINLINVDGDNLSQGQKQLLTLSRAAYLKKKY